MGRIHVTEGLALSAPSEVVSAHTHLRDLVIVARRLAPFTFPTSVVTERGCGCPAVGCILANVPSGVDLCRLVQRVVAIELEPPLPAVRPQPRDAADLVLEFRVALATSVDAIRTCRQLLHPSGMCWFTEPGGGHGCGEVLRVAHLGGLSA